MKPRLRVLALALALALLTTGSGVVRADVLTGPIENVPESEGLFTWGDGVHDLFQQWSFASPSSGWFYGSSFGTSNADIYIYRGLADPTIVTGAEFFPYHDQVESAAEGDVVFFRGTNGRYGAWKITSVDPVKNPPPVPLALLQGQWYFQTDGSGCFAPSCGVTPAARRTWGMIKQLYR